MFINIAMFISLFLNHIDVVRLVIICDTTIIYAYYGISAFKDNISIKAQLKEMLIEQKNDKESKNDTPKDNSK